MERMAQNGNIEMSQAFYMEVWNGYERSRELEEENKNLKRELEDTKQVSERDYNIVQNDNNILRNENKKLKEKIRFLEECLDNKEKVNKSLREELDKLKSTYVYDAKQVRDIC